MCDKCEVIERLTWAEVFRCGCKSENMFLCEALKSGSLLMLDGCDCPCHHMQEQAA